MQLRFLLLAAVAQHDAGGGLQHRIEPRQVHPRARERSVEGGQAEIDDLGIAPGDGGVVDAQPFGHAGTEVVHDHVGALHQLVEDLSARRLLEVQDQAALALAHFDRAPAGGARGEVGVGGVDLDYLGAILGQRTGRARAGEHGGQVEHGDPVEDGGVGRAGLGSAGAWGGGCARGGVGRVVSLRCGALGVRCGCVLSAAGAAAEVVAAAAGRCTAAVTVATAGAAVTAVGHRAVAVQEGRQVGRARRAGVQPGVGGAPQRGLHAELAYRPVHRVIYRHGQRRGLRFRRLQPVAGAAVDAERHPEPGHDRGPFRRRLAAEGRRHLRAHQLPPLRREVLDELDVVGAGQIIPQRLIGHPRGDQIVVDPQRLQELRAVAPVGAGPHERPLPVGGLIAVGTSAAPGGPGRRSVAAVRPRRPAASAAGAPPAPPRSGCRTRAAAPRSGAASCPSPTSSPRTAAPRSPRPGRWPRARRAPASPPARRARRRRRN